MTGLGNTLAALSAALAIALGASAARAQGVAPGYVVLEFKIKDAEGFKTYGQRAPATVSQYGGKFVVRGAKPEGLKGDAPQGGPFIVLSFASAEQARRWASSPEYSALVPLRDQAADTRAFIIEGAMP
jgi:uncharacterized protein (DUF1330 family)